MPATKKEQIYALAEPQHGFFTSAQAKADGLLQNTLTAMARRGVIERVSRVVYRLANFPLSQLSQYMEAVLWPQQGVKGVISHQSALAFHGLSDVSPAKVHITRVRRLARQRHGLLGGPDWRRHGSPPRDRNAKTLRTRGGKVQLAAEARLRNHEIDPFIIDMENNGQLSNSGDFRTNPADVTALVTDRLAAAT